jgi:hypothetical protein
MSKEKNYPRTHEWRTFSQIGDRPTPDVAYRYEVMPDVSTVPVPPDGLHETSASAHSYMFLHFRACVWSFLGEFIKDTALREKNGTLLQISRTTGFIQQYIKLGKPVISTAI